MSIQPLLQKASFRGAEFFIEVATTTGGRKTVTHEFPNTDRRVIEDMGKKQRSFSLDAIINGTGQDYFTKRNALLNALETAGAGVLIHPFYGQVIVVNDPYTLVEDLSSMGRAKISITFHRADSNIYPVITGSNKISVMAKAQAALDASQSATASNFIIPRILSNIQDAAAKLTSFTNVIQAQLNTINQYSSQLASVSTSVAAFEDTINSAIQAPAIMAANISAAFDSLLSLADTPANALQMMRNIFGFGNDDEPVAKDTQSLVDRQTNRDALNNDINVLALASVYSIVPTMSFNTVEDINAVSAILEAQYASLPDTLDPAVYEALEDLRNEVRNFLDTAALTAWRVSSINAPNIPATILSFMYYGNVDQADTIIALNKTKEPTFVSGPTEILTR